MGYKVKLNIFEGPFDLLVYLIENAKMDIYDIKVSEITEQYLSYLNKMKEIEVEVASEFMVLAAALIELKSKMLLPRINKDGVEVLDEDPRTDLVERLIMYKKFKFMSEILSQKEEEGSRIFEKPQEDIKEFLEAPDEHLILDINKFVKAFELFIDKRKRVSDVKHHYERKEMQRISADDRIKFIHSLFEMDEQKILSFKETVQDDQDKYDIVLSFVSILEMVKGRTISAEQRALFGDILLKKIALDKNMEGKNDD
ncbi:MAG: segregation/condensation protein A [Anaerovoracaceae bacterium]